MLSARSKWRAEVVKPDQKGVQCPERYIPKNRVVATEAFRGSQKQVATFKANI
jgi:hypothetical protein